MKKVIIPVLATLSIAWSGNSFGGTIIGNADLKKNGDGTYCLTCPGSGACYRYPAGGGIYIYKNGDPNAEGYGWYEVVRNCQGEYEGNEEPAEWDNVPVTVKELLP